jgi:hypothetical protein
MAKGDAQAANQATRGLPKPGGMLTGAPPEVADAANEFLFARPTDHPEVPVTNGLPFGDGASYVQYANEDERSMRERVANTLAASPSADPDVLRFVERLRRGE